MNSNPAVAKLDRLSDMAYGSEQRAMTVAGTANKTALLLLVIGIFGTWFFDNFSVIKVTETEVELSGGALEAGFQFGDGFLMWYLGALLLGFAIALYTIFNPTVARITSFLYAACEGIVLGGATAIAEAEYPGVGIQAILLTTACAAGAWFLFRTGVVRVTAQFKAGVLNALVGILLYYVANLVGQIFFGVSMPGLHEGGWLSVIVSMCIVAIACAALIVDYHEVQESVENGVNAEYEWYAAFSLCITLVWLYLEVLRLLLNAKRK